MKERKKSKKSLIVVMFMAIHGSIRCSRHGGWDKLLVNHGLKKADREVFPGLPRP